MVRHPGLEGLVAHQPLAARGVNDLVRRHLRGGLGRGHADDLLFGKLRASGWRPDDRNLVAAAAEDGLYQRRSREGGSLPGSGCHQLTIALVHSSPTASHSLRLYQGDADARQRRVQVLCEGGLHVCRPGLTAGTSRHFIPSALLLYHQRGDPAPIGRVRSPYQALRPDAVPCKLGISGVRRCGATSFALSSGGAKWRGKTLNTLLPGAVDPGEQKDVHGVCWTTGASIEVGLDVSGLTFRHVTMRRDASGRAECAGRRQTVRDTIPSVFCGTYDVSRTVRGRMPTGASLSALRCPLLPWMPARHPKSHPMCKPEKGLCIRRRPKASVSPQSTSIRPLRRPALGSKLVLCAARTSAHHSIGPGAIGVFYSCPPRSSAPSRGRRAGSRT